MPSSSIVFQSARLWHGWLIADSMLIIGLSPASAASSLNSRSARSSSSDRRFANARMPIASPYDAITGTASRTCSAATPSITMPRGGSSPWIDGSGEITNAPPPSRTSAAWNDASVRSDGLKNNSDSTLPSSARGSGCFSSRAARSSSARTSSCGKSARSLKRFIRELLQRGGQKLHVRALEHERRQEPQDVRIGARARQDVPREQRVAHLRGGRRGLEPQQESLALHTVHGADDARLPAQRRKRPHDVDEPSLLDRGVPRD